MHGSGHIAPRARSRIQPLSQRELRREAQGSGARRLWASHTLHADFGPDAAAAVSKRLMVPTERVHLTVDEARSLSERALAGMGLPPDEAAIIADHVIDAALCGYEYSGLAKL